MIFSANPKSLLESGAVLPSGEKKKVESEIRFEGITSTSTPCLQLLAAGAVTIPDDVPTGFRAIVHLVTAVTN